MRKGSRAAKRDGGGVLLGGAALALGLFLGLSACGDSKEEDTAAWACVEGKDAQGSAMCSCSASPQPGDSIDAAACASDPASGYNCCSFDGEVCRCTTDFSCEAPGSTELNTCEEAYLCAVDPLPKEGDPCSKPGLHCPGSGSDSLCWDWECTCSDELKFHCEPGTCA